MLWLLQWVHLFARNSTDLVGLFLLFFAFSLTVDLLEVRICAHVHSVSLVVEVRTLDDENEAFDCRFLSSPSLEIIGIFTAVHCCEIPEGVHIGTYRRLRGLTAAIQSATDCTARQSS